MLRKAWESYRNEVLPQNAPFFQVLECRRAFYAGAQALMSGVLNSLDPGSNPTEQDIEIMTGIQSELSQFCESVRNGVN